MWPWLSVIIAVLALVALGLYRFMPHKIGHAVRTPRSVTRGGIDRKVMAVVVSLLCLLFAFYIILVGDSDTSHEWAFGTVGTVVGFWLRPEN